MFSTFNSKRRWIWILGTLILFIVLIAFTEARQAEKRCRQITVRLDQVDGHQFLTRKDVTGYLTNEGTDPVIGEPFDELNFRQLEQRLRRHGLIKNCQVSRDLPGNLVVSIQQPQPVARLVATAEDLRFLQGQYVSEEGRFFPISMNHSVRVPLLSGAYFGKHTSLTDTSSRDLLDLLNRIRSDAFWKAQIIEVSVNERGEVIMWPAYGSHQIELGTPTNLEMKFKKLKLFYKSVLAAKGWERYSRVNVQYRNQIVCE